MVGKATAVDTNKASILAVKDELLSTGEAYDIPFDERYIVVNDFEDKTLDALLDKHGPELQTSLDKFKTMQTALLEARAVCAISVPQEAQAC